MKGLLIVNYSQKNAKFVELSKALKNSFSAEKTELVVKNNSDIVIDYDINKETFEVNYGHFDFILFWDKDLPLAHYLEHLGYHLFNSSKAIELCDDKIKINEILKSNNIPSPKTMVLPMSYSSTYDQTTINNIESNFAYPFILKEAFGSFGQQVYLINNKVELKSKLDGLYPKNLLVQEYLSYKVGEDVRVHVIGNKVVGAVRRTNTNSFIANATQGGVMTQFVLNEKTIKLCEKVSKLFSLDFGGIDLLFVDENEFSICEINSNSHFSNFQKATDIDIAKLIAKYIKINIE